MSNSSLHPRSTPGYRPRVLLFGMRCPFTVAALRALLEGDCELVAVALPGATDGIGKLGSITLLPMAGGERNTVDAVAAAAGIPVLTLRGLNRPEQRELIAGGNADIFTAACFPWRLPARLRQIAPYGCLNLHPSLLPRWRGPEPLFWTFRSGDRETGVTVHVMDDGFDTGPIVAQERLSIPDLVDGAALERELGRRGGRLLARAAWLTVLDMVEEQAQYESKATRAPAPTDDDLVVSTDLPAQDLANMVAGIGSLWGPLTIVSHIDGGSISARTVLHVDRDAAPAHPFHQTGDAVVVACATGSVTFAQISSVHA